MLKKDFFDYFEANNFVNKDVKMVSIIRLFFNTVIVFCFSINPNFSAISDNLWSLSVDPNYLQPVSKPKLVSITLSGGGVVKGVFTLSVIDSKGKPFSSYSFAQRAKQNLIDTYYIGLDGSVYAKSLNSNNQSIISKTSSDFRIYLYSGGEVNRVDARGDRVYQPKYIFNLKQNIAKAFYSWKIPLSYYFNVDFASEINYQNQKLPISVSVYDRVMNLSKIYYLDNSGKIYQKTDNSSITPLYISYESFFATTASAGFYPVMQSDSLGKLYSNDALMAVVASIKSKLGQLQEPSPNLPSPTLPPLITSYKFKLTSEVNNFAPTTLFTTPAGVAIAQINASDIANNNFVFYVTGDRQVYSAASTDPVNKNYVEWVNTSFSPQDAEVINKEVASLVDLYLSSRFRSPEQFSLFSTPQQINNILMIGQFIATDLSLAANLMTFYLGIDGNYYQQNQSNSILLSNLFSFDDLAIIESSMKPHLTKYLSSHFKSPTQFSTINGWLEISNVAMVAQFNATDLSPSSNLRTFYLGIDGNYYQQDQPNLVNLNDLFSASDVSIIQSSIQQPKNNYLNTHFKSPSVITTPYNGARQFTAMDLNTPAKTYSFTVLQNRTVMQKGVTMPISYNCFAWFYSAFSPLDASYLVKNINIPND